MEETKVTQAEVVHNAPAGSSEMADSNSRTMALIIWLTSSTIIIPLLFILLDNYKKDKFVQFHAWESLLFSLVGGLLVGILSWTCIIPLVFFVLWIIGMVKAYQGEMWMLPIIGEFSLKQAEASASK